MKKERLLKTIRRRLRCTKTYFCKYTTLLNHSQEQIKLFYKIDFHISPSWDLVYCNYLLAHGQKMLVQQRHFKGGKQEIKNEKVNDEMYSQRLVGKGIKHNYDQKDEQLEGGKPHEHAHKGFRVALAGAQQDVMHHSSNDHKKSEECPALRVLLPYRHKRIPHRQPPAYNGRKHQQTH